MSRIQNTFFTLACKFVSYQLIMGFLLLSYPHFIICLHLETMSQHWKGSLNFHCVQAKYRKSKKWPLKWLHCNGFRDASFPDTNRCHTPILPSPIFPSPMEQWVPASEVLTEDKRVSSDSRMILSLGACRIHCLSCIWPHCDSTIVSQPGYRMTETALTKG